MMENERVLIATDRATLREVLTEIMKPEAANANQPDFEADRLTKAKAAKLAGISIPTLDRRIKEGIFKEYALGRHKYLLRSEVIQALRNIK